MQVSDLPNTNKNPRREFDGILWSSNASNCQNLLSEWYLIILEYTWYLGAPRLSKSQNQSESEFGHPMSPMGTRTLRSSSTCPEWMVRRHVARPRAGLSAEVPRWVGLASSPCLRPCDLELGESWIIRWIILYHFHAISSCFWDLMILIDLIYLMKREWQWKGIWQIHGLEFHFKHIIFAYMIMAKFKLLSLACL